MKPRTMPKLKLSRRAGRQAGQAAVHLPAAIHRDLAAYAELLASETGHGLHPTGEAHPAHDRALHGVGPRLYESAARQGLIEAFSVYSGRNFWSGAS